MSANSATRPQARCLIVDDDPSTSELIFHSLKRDNYRVDSVTNGEDAISLCREEPIDVILLDYQLPGISGQQVCRAIREFSDAYILMVSANSNEVDRVLTLSLGADDYVTKPFSPSELTERVRAMLRRPRHHVCAGTETENGSFVKRIGDLTFDTDARLAATDDAFIDLTDLESTLLAVLVESSPEAISRKEIVERVWERKYTADDHVVDVHISNIRSKLRGAGLSSVRIQAVRARGYRLIAEQLPQVVAE
jgi:DNA-binding response OmpR family regulator